MASPNLEVSAVRSGGPVVNEDEMLIRRSRSPALNREASPNIIDNSKDHGKSISESPVGQAVTKLAEKMLTDKERERLEDEKAKLEAEKERKMAREMIEIVRSDYISPIDLTNMQAKYYVKRELISYVNFLCTEHIEKCWLLWNGSC